MIIGLFIISAIILIKYKPMYAVKLDSRKIGYLSKIENIDNYISEIKENDNIAFVELKQQPQISINLVNRNIKNSDDEIKEQIKENLSIEYTSYAITYKKQNIAYLSNMEKAESVINELEKNKNITDLGILQVYSDNYDEITAQEKDEAIIKISKEIKKQDKAGNKTKVASNNKKRITDTIEVEDADNSKKVSDDKKNSKKEKTAKQKSEVKSKSYVSKKDDKKSKNTTVTVTKKIATNLLKPLNGIITSRFGGRRSPGGIGSTNHKGLDIASKKGTTIKAAAGGTVKFAGYKGSLGNLVIIDHGNGMQTYYGHSSKIYVKKGQKVEAGEKIAAVGSTGAATGPHLHFEIHIKGKVINPQKYLY